MSGSDTSLCSLLRDKVEIESLVGFLFFNQVGVDDRTAWRVLNRLSISGLDEHSLRDSLVYYNQSDTRSLGDFIVERNQRILELLNLSINYILSHGLPDSISVDDDSTWLLSIISMLESAYCI